MNAVCPSGSVVTGGGFSNPNGLPIIASVVDQRNNAWFVEVNNPGASGSLFGAEAICAAAYP